MKLPIKYCAPIIAASLSLFSATSANAGVTTYTDQGSFLAALGSNPYVTDNYTNPGYHPDQPYSEYTDAQMSSVLGLTTYQATGYPNINSVSQVNYDGYYGFYGNEQSFVLGFNSAGLGGNGVYGVGFLYLNPGGSYFDPDDPTFDALVTFNDHTQEDIQLGVGAGLNSLNYLGVISDIGISSIYIGLDGQPNGQNGFSITDLTVTTPVSEPGTYALWMTGLGLLALMARQRKYRNYKKM